MTLQPTNITKQKSKTTGVGYDDELAEATLAQESFESVLNHVYRVGFAPLNAHHSQSFTLDKKSGKPKVLGLRILHMICALSGAASTDSFSASPSRGHLHLMLAAAGLIDDKYSPRDANYEAEKPTSPRATSR
jgi:hypothetical protein